MNLRVFYRLAVLVIVVQLVVAGWGLATVGIGATVPIHWNAGGDPNGYGPAWLGFLLVPSITVFLVCLFSVIPRIEPRRTNLLRSSSAYRTMAVATLVLMLGVQLVAVFAGAGHRVPITPVIGGGIGLLFAVLGNVMTTVRSNFLFGVRTPWTLTSELAWDRTHRLIGRLWVVGGALMFLASLLGSSRLLIAVVVAFTVGSLAIAFVYSYRVWSRDPNHRSFGGDA